MMKQRVFVLAGILACVLLGSSEANAYIGPGAGLSAFGSLLALIVAVFAGIVGFIWYPIKRLLKKMRGSAVEPAANVGQAADDQEAQPQTEGPRKPEE